MVWIPQALTSVGDARIIPRSYLGGAISTARKPSTLYRAINRRETERKRGGSDVDAHAIPRRSPALCSQYRARPAKIGL